MSKLKNLLIIIAIVLGVALILPQTKAASTTTQKYNSKKDTLYTPKIDTITETLVLAGSISTDQIASVRFQNSGKLVWVGVKVGDHVRRGQALASIDKSELRKNLATQFNNYRTQLSQFNDTQETYKKTKENFLVTDTIQRILDRTQYSLDNSVINYELTDMAIKEATVVSPIDGVVTSMDQPFAGSNITPASATITVINPSHLYFRSDIDQEAVTRVKIGQPVTLTLDSFPDKEINSHINFISFTPIAGQTSTLYEIRFDLPLGNNQDLNYRIGMDGDTNIVLSSANSALTIPTDAVGDDNGQRFVYLKKGNELVRQNIKTAIENDISTQVIEGLNQNDQVAVIQK
ncbi:MAG: efflux RND transporter periplasmic adaptor subunit [Microgenomates group bacterium]